MGVRSCYGARAARLGTQECIRRGVSVLHNLIWDAKTTAPTKTEVRECGKSGDMLLCRALIRYNGSPQKYDYARQGTATYRKLVRQLKSTEGS